MERVGSWIKGDGWCFHAGSAQTGYPSINIRAVEGPTAMAFHAFAIEPHKPAHDVAVFAKEDEAVAFADRLSALILDAHRCGSAKPAE